MPSGLPPVGDVFGLHFSAPALEVPQCPPHRRERPQQGNPHQRPLAHSKPVEDEQRGSASYGDIDGQTDAHVEEELPVRRPVVDVVEIVIQ